MTKPATTAVFLGLGCLSIFMWISCSVFLSVFDFLAMKQSEYFVLELFIKTVNNCFCFACPCLGLPAMGLFLYRLLIGQKSISTVSTDDPDV